MEPSVTTTNPWEIAKERYLSMLEPEESILFNEATVENLYYKTSNSDCEDRKHSKTRRAASAIHPLIEKIGEYGKAMDVYASIAPIMIAPIWGSIRVVLILAQKFAKLYDKITDCLGRIGDILPRLVDFRQIFSAEKHPRLNQALAFTYLDVVEICMEFKTMIKTHQKNPLKRMVHSISLDWDRKFKDVEARFRMHRKTVDREAEVCHMIEAAESRAIVIRDRHLQELNNKVQLKKSLMQQLCAVNPAQRHDKVRSARHKNTGAWLFQRPEWALWLRSQASVVICCHGIPGCGKSILASSVIDSLAANLGPKLFKIAYYYCDYADKRTLDPTAILGGLVRTLFAGNDLPEEIIRLVRKYYQDGEHLPSVKDVLEILRTSILLSKDINIIIDGIDEVNEEDRAIVHQSIANLMDLPGSCIKVVMLCREDFGKMVQKDPSLRFSIQISEKTISTDIESFVRHSVTVLLSSNGLVIRGKELEEEIITTLVKGAKGMFLWVVFQLSELCTAESDRGIKTILQNLPKDLSETYDRLLSRIVGVERQDLVKRLFRWIVCSRRPLQVNELCEAIAFTIDDDFWDATKIPTNIERLVRACGNLVVLDDTTNTIQLAHYTVQQYLVRGNTANSDHFHFNLQEADDLLGEVCVAYLNFSDFETQTTVYEDNGIGSGMTAIEKAIITGRVTANPGSSANTVLQLRQRIRPQPKSTSIQYARHIPKKPKPVEDLIEEYHLLNYARENWLWHTAKFSLALKRSNKRDRLFHDLVIHKQLPFPFRPWIININASREKHHIGAIGWALMTNHCPLLHAMINSDPTFDPKSYLIKAASWFFGSDTIWLSRVTKEMSERLRLCEGGLLDSVMQINGWLYLKIVNACRQGYLDILSLAYGPIEPPSEILKDSVILLQLRAYLIIEAAVSNQQDVLKFLLGREKRRISDRRIYIFTKCEQGLQCNALELAIFAGHIDIATQLVSRGWGFGLDQNDINTIVENASRCGKADVEEAMFSVVFGSSCRKSQVAMVDS